MDDDTEFQKAVADGRKEGRLRFREPADASLRDSLSRVLRNRLNQKIWAKELPDLERWFQDDKPNFGNLADWLETKSWDQVAELLPNNGAKGLDNLRNRHAAAIKLFRDEFGLWPDTEATGPYVVLPADLGPGVTTRVPPLATFLVTNHPATEGVPYRSDLIVTASVEAPLPDGFTADLKAAKGKTPPTPAEPSRDVLDDLREAIKSEAVVLVAPGHFPKDNWLDVLAYAWLADRRDKLLAKPFRPLTVLVGSREYGRLHKMAAGVSWAFGGRSVEVAGHKFAPAPDLAVAQVAPAKGALMPPGWELLPAWATEKPHQTLLPLDYTGEQESPPLPVALTGNSPYAISLGAAKLGLLIMAADARHTSTVRELVERIYPGVNKRMLRPSHYDTVRKGLKELDQLRVVLPNGLSYRIFDCPVPWREMTPAEYDETIHLGLARSFEAILHGEIGKVAGASYRGDFIFDLTAAMALPGKEPGLLRQLIRASAFWNAYWRPGTTGTPDLERIPEVPTENWLAMCNYLPPAGVESRKGKANGYRGSNRRSEAIAKAVEEARQLERLGLVVVNKADKKGVRLLPTADYLEAVRLMRVGGHRLPKD